MASPLQDDARLAARGQGLKASLKRDAGRGQQVENELGACPVEPWLTPFLDEALSPSTECHRSSPLTPGTWESCKGRGVLALPPPPHFSVSRPLLATPMGSRLQHGPPWAGELTPLGLLSLWAGTEPQMAFLEKRTGIKEISWLSKGQV